MTGLGDWSNPITRGHGEAQAGVIPERLLPSRQDLLQSRLDHQIQLVQADVIRWTPILVTPDGVIIDGHHAVRAAAEIGVTVDVTIQRLAVRDVGLRIQELPIRQR